MRVRKLLSVILFLLFSSLPDWATVPVDRPSDYLRVIYNNIPGNNKLKPDWGYAAWISFNGMTVLFDSGARPQILKNNMALLGLDPANVDQLIISHNHSDHTGGLDYVIPKLNPELQVYLPEPVKSFEGIAFKKEIKISGKFEKAGEGIWITEVYQDAINQIKEEAVVLEKGDAIILITGCAHPGIVEICRKIKDKFPDKQFRLVTGGFHLLQMKPEEVLKISGELKKLGIQSIAPSHCTGDKAIRIFKESWGVNCLDLNLGDVYPID
jgi:7,8-dihydropterin-6-yl-methyl-4-(beta-D-ribofuranosyl)aminobenzene 5'-phosphate synthase